jgi:hypothetical protein
MQWNIYKILPIYDLNISFNKFPYKTLAIAHKHADHVSILSYGD